MQPLADALKETERIRTDAQVRAEEIRAGLHRDTYSKTLWLCAAILAVGVLALFLGKPDVTTQSISAVMGFAAGFFAGRSKLV
jgi:hypothetical protein